MACGAVVYFNMEKQLQIQAALERSQVVTHHFNRILTIIVDMETGIRGYLLSGEDSYLEPFSKAEGLFDEEARQTMAAVAGDAAQSERVEQISAAKKEWIEGPAVGEMMLRKKLTRGMIDAAAFAAGFKESKGKILTDRVRIAVSAALEHEKSRTAELMLANERSAQASKQSATIGILIATIIGMGLLIMTVRRLSLRIKEVIAALFSQAQDLNSVSSELTEASTSLSRANDDTADALQQAAAAVAEISEMTASSANMARDAQEKANVCSNDAEKGSIAVGKVLESMNQTRERTDTIRSQFAENNRKLMDIVSRIKEISMKTQVINDIVFQTKLLSFNASVEAARAGEHGKGFAVVAEEVGNLANMSGNAAKEISELLSANETIVTSTVAETASILESLVANIEERVRDGVSKSEECQVVFGDIQQKIKVIQSVAGQISHSSAEQAKGVEDISKTVTQISQIVQNNAVMAKNSSAIATNLHTASSHLDERVVTMLRLFEKEQPAAAEQPAAENRKAA